MNINVNCTSWISNKLFLLTGGFEESTLDFLDELLSSNGGVHVYNAGPSVDYLIWDPAKFGETEKLKRTRQYNGFCSNTVILTIDEFYKKLSGEEFELSVKQSSHLITHIAKYVVKVNPEYADSYLETHQLSYSKNQDILVELLRQYNQYTLLPQQKWCNRIAKTPELQTRLYVLAIEYFAKVGEYDKAEMVCDLAEASLPGANTGDTPEIEYLNLLRKRIEKYRKKPYWPSSSVAPSIREQLSAIYEANGIQRIKTKKKENATVRDKQFVSNDSEEIEREVWPYGHKVEKLSSEKINEIQASIDAVDYSSNDDNKYTFFVGHNCFNISGIAKNTIELFVDGGWIKEYADVFRLKDHKCDIIDSGVVSEQRMERLLESIENARNISDIRFLQSLRIPQVNENASRTLLEKYTLAELIEIGSQHEDLYDLVHIKGISSLTSASFLMWFESEDNFNVMRYLMNEVTIVEESKQEKGQNCEGMVFVVTGDVHIFKNRDAIKEYIIKQGGTLSGSVGKKTTYLINNDLGSNSSKNLKAKELNVPIISEEIFIEMFGSNL